MKKLKAIEYLVKNSVYSNEWTGAGMYEAILNTLDKKGNITTQWLDTELIKAANF